MGRIGHCHRRLATEIWTFRTPFALAHLSARYFDPVAHDAAAIPPTNTVIIATSQCFMIDLAALSYADYRACLGGAYGARATRCVKPQAPRRASAVESRNLHPNPRGSAVARPVLQE